MRITGSLKTALIMLLGLAVALGAALLYGHTRWQAGSKKILDDLEAVRRPVTPTNVDVKELLGLPPPVQRYFRAVLRNGQPMISAVRVQHIGTFNLSENGQQWKPFTSHQRVTLQPPGFDWEGRIRLIPGLTVRVHDAYVAGEGILHATLLGLFTLVHLRGTPEVAQGELMRYLAEAAWYPTALLPSQGVHWQAVDEDTAEASVRDGDTSVTLLFRFDSQSLITSVRAVARGRRVGDTVVATPWEGSVTRYAWRDGMRVPLEGEVAWILPDGPQPYWRGRIVRLDYEFAR